MGHRHLVVSDPPHHELDHDRASELLGIAPAEVRMKANFAAPEIWLTFSDAEEATDAALALGEAGLNTATIDGRGFLDVPGPAPLSSFAFTDESFVARFGDEERRLPYDAKIFGVFCQPPKGSGPPPFKRSSAGRIRLRSTVAWSEKIAGSGQGGDGFEALEFLTNLDLYWTTDDKVSRISIVKDSADFSGLGDLGYPEMCGGVAGSGKKV